MPQVQQSSNRALLKIKMIEMNEERKYKVYNITYSQLQICIPLCQERMKVFYPFLSFHSSQMCALAEILYAENL